MADKKLKLLYLADFFQTETDEEHPKTIQDMLTALSRRGISAERKSIYSDIELLRLYGMDILTVKGKHFGYYLADRTFQLAELKLLIDAVQASPFLSRSRSMELIGKLEGLASRPQAHRLRRQVYVMNRIRTPNERLYYTVDGINTAINENRRITFRYFDYAVGGGKAYRRDGALYLTNPVALCVDRYYYLVAFDEALGDYRHYRLDRMEQLTVTDTPRAPLPPDFDLGFYVKSRFDMYKGETVTVTLRFASPLLNAVIDRFGADAHMHADGADHFCLTAPVELGPTFFGWLCQFGAQAQLLSPAPARSAYLTHLRHALDAAAAD